MKTTYRPIIAAALLTLGPNNLSGSGAWGDVMMNDVDGTAASELTLDINGAGATERPSDGYLRIMTGADGFSGIGANSYIEMAVSFQYLKNHSTTGLDQGQTSSIAAETIANGTDHISIGPNGDVADGLTSASPRASGWSGPISTVSEVPTTPLVMAGVASLFVLVRWRHQALTARQRPMGMESTKIDDVAKLAASLGLATWAAQAQPPTLVLDTEPAFMQIVTNYTLQTNVVIVTNYVVLTNSAVATNYYNADGQLLMPVAPKKLAIPGLIPIPATKPAEPDPSVVKARQLQAIRDLLAQGLLATSNKVSTAGSFTSNATQRIAIPQDITSFDRKKTQALLTAMNLTAERAAPEAVTLLLKEAAQLKTEDPEAVIKGDPDAATRLLLAAHEEELDPRLLTLVQQAGEGHKLRESYNAVILKGGGLLGSLLGSGPSVDIHAHVAQGLWHAITNHLAEQEGLIRGDVSARKTPALKEAFKK